MSRIRVGPIVTCLKERGAKLCLVRWACPIFIVQELHKAGFRKSGVIRVGLL